MKASKLLLALPMLILAPFLAQVLATPPALAETPATASQCAACHGTDGIAKMPDAPNLAGQNEAYLVKALKDFRSGARENEIMSLMAKNLSDQDIATLANYYSSIPVSVKNP